MHIPLHQITPQTLKLAIVVGNPRPKCRTLKVAETLVEKLFGPASQGADIIDLADYWDEVLSWPSEKMDALNARVAVSDVVIFASPTYKATYTGLLKVFLDRYGANRLSGVIAIPLLPAPIKSTPWAAKLCHPGRQRTCRSRVRT